MHKVVLSTVGTLGDLHPMIAVAVQLKACGLAPVVASFAEYREKVQAEGIEFHPTQPSLADVLRALRMDQAELAGRMIRRDDFLFRKVLFPYLRAAYEDGLQIERDSDVVLAGSVAFGARLAAEKLRIPWIAVVLQPLLFLSAYDPPTVARPSWLGSLLRALGPRAARRIIDFGKGTLLRPLTRPVSDFRAAVGLPKTHRDPIFDGQFSASGAIGLYSSMLGAAQPDHPCPSEIVGFSFYDSENGGTTGLDAQLSAFLAAGSEPLVFTLGSMAVHHAGADQFFRDSLGAARRIGRRAVLLVGDRIDPALRNDPAEDFILRRYVAHSLLFPHAAAIIHQAGIGSLAQALRAGRPQLIVPFFGDQFDNAERARSLGVARVIWHRRYGVSAAAKELGRLLGESGYATQAVRVAANVSAERGAEHAAELVCRFLEHGSIG